MVSQRQSNLTGSRDSLKPSYLLNKGIKNLFEMAFEEKMLQGMSGSFSKKKGNKRYETSYV